MKNKTAGSQTKQQGPVKVYIFYIVSSRLSSGLWKIHFKDELWSLQVCVRVRKITGTEKLLQPWCTTDERLLEMDLVYYVQVKTGTFLFNIPAPWVRCAHFTDANKFTQVCTALIQFKRMSSSHLCSEYSSKREPIAVIRSATFHSILWVRFPLLHLQTAPVPALPILKPDEEQLIKDKPKQGRSIVGRCRKTCQHTSQYHKPWQPSRVSAHRFWMLYIVLEFILISYWYSTAETTVSYIYAPSYQLQVWKSMDLSPPQYVGQETLAENPPPKKPKQMVVQNVVVHLQSFLGCVSHNLLF